MISFTNLPPQLKEGAAQLEKFLNSAKSNISVTIEKCETGLKVCKDNNNATVFYSATNTFFRAMYVLMSNADKQSFTLQENCMFDEFGVMQDLSRNAVATVSTLKKMILNVALMGYNMFQLYTEDTLEVSGEPYFGYMRGRLTQAEIKQLDQYCLNFGVQLVPCIQTLAHINQITRYAEYEKITDVDDILMVGEPRTYALIENLISSCAQCFSSRNINIGMDEAHMLGLGKYLDKHGARSRYEIMWEHLQRVSEILGRYGFSAVMWSDMFFRLVFGKECYDADPDKIPAELLKMIPKNIKLLYWDYYSTVESRYDSVMKKHKKLSDNVGFAGGAWKWLGFVPDNRYSILALDPALNACKTNDIKYCLITSWGDNGGESSMFSVLPALNFAADKSYGSQFNGNGISLLSGLSAKEFMCLDLPNQVAAQPTNVRCNHSKFFLYNDLFFNTFDSVVKKGQNQKFAEYSKILSELAAKATDYKYIFEVEAALCDVLKIKTELGLKIRKAYKFKDKAQLENCATDVKKTIEYVIAFKNAVYKMWQTDNKPFGLEIQHIRLGGLIERLNYVHDKLEGFASGKIDTIEELEEKVLEFGYRNFAEDDGLEIGYNLWGRIVSPSIIG